MRIFLSPVGIRKKLLVAGCWLLGKLTTNNQKLTTLTLSLSLTLTLSPNLVFATDHHPILGPCTRYEDSYSGLNFETEYIENWPTFYHETVDGIVEEYFELPEIDCEAEDYEELFTPGPLLEDLASKLPPWEDSDDRDRLTRFDLDKVLLEYLRVYECSIIEFRSALEFDTAVEEFDRAGITDMFMDYFAPELLEDAFERSLLIERERLVARRALHRTLTLIGAFDRLRPLEIELECAQRVTLDIRNAMSLTAEVSSCYPRVWNAKDPLRDFED